MCTIQSLWVKGDLSDMEHYSIRSFLKQGHTYHLYTYDNISNIPEGTVIKDAEEILSSNRIFTYSKHNSYAGFANMFRYKLLYERGGIWADTDFLCIQPFAFQSKYLFCGDKKYKKDRWGRYLNYVNNCMIKAPAGSPLMESCFEFADQADNSNLDWGETGPRLLNYRVEQFGLKQYISPYRMFCPVHWWDWETFISRSALKAGWFLQKIRMFNVFGIHFWNECWRRSGSSKSMDCFQPRLYEKLIYRYI